MRDPLAEDAKALHREFDDLLAKGLDDYALRDAIEALNARRGLPYVFHRLVRTLLERDPVLFAPVVRPRVDTWGYDRKGNWHNPWQTKDGKRDLAWLLAFAEERDDAALFRAAMRLHLDGVVWQERDAMFCEQLLDRFSEAEEPHRRASILARFTGLGRLDDDTALTLYELAPLMARSFITGHLPWRVWGKDDVDLMPTLLEEVQERDSAFHFELYRRLVGEKTWRRDARAVVAEASDEELVDELEKRHPENRFLRKAGAVFVEVLEERGDTGLPYVMRHASQVVRGFFGRGGYNKLLKLSRKRGYDALWAGILRHAAKVESYNEEVERLARDADDPKEARRRLQLLAGAGRELNFGGLGLARVQALQDDTACTLLERYPELLAGPFRRHLFAGWAEAYPRLVDAALKAGDETIIDYLASRFVTRGGPYIQKEVLAMAERLSKHYEQLRDDPAVFAERAANVLGQVPPFVIHGYDALLETNRLARLLYEHAAESYLASPSAIRDLLEAPEIHVQRLAFRALSLPVPIARRLAVTHLDLLCATLLRPLHRRTRLLAFEALDNAAHDPEGAERVLAVAREAMHLPDERYPKEELVGLIGRVLHRHASLRAERERPRVYR